MRRTIISSLLLFFLGCATLGGVVEKKPELERGIREDLDPLSLENDDVISELREEELISPVEGKARSPQPLKPRQTPKKEMIPGYRIQICATSNEEKARAVKREAMLKFDERVYMIYDTPYYKVRIGDCRTRVEAEELKKIAIQKGFKDAWIVRTMISKRGNW